MKLPDTLISRLSKRQCIAFVGAGFSMPCGLPSWESLLKLLLNDAKAAQNHIDQKEILQTCRNAIKARQYSLAVSILQDVIPPSDLDEAIRQKFGMEIYHSSDAAVKSRMQKRMKHLINSPWAGILTTNYDELIEYAIGKYNQRVVIQAYGNDPMLGSILCAASPAAFFFVKLHGSVIGGNYVLGTEEYDRTYINTPQVASFLISLFLRYHIVFIGCSLEDEILRIRRKLCYDFKGRIPTAYALLPHTDHNKARKHWLIQYAQIETLLYRDKKGLPEHYAVDKFLERAANCTDTYTDHERAHDISTEIKNFKIDEKLGKIGAVNLDLLKIIYYANSKHSVQHIQLLNLSLLQTKTISQTIQDNTPEERVYRIFFMVSIGLLQTKKLSDGSRQYIMHRSIVNAFKKFI